MSYHWENTIWQSKDGSWNRGFFRRISMAPSFYDEYDDYDSEWDDEFDNNYFDAVKTNLASKADADKYNPYGNPGSVDVIAYKGNAAEAKRLDLLAYWFHNPDERVKHERKELLRKNREHFKVLAAEWTPEVIREAVNGNQLTARIKADERAFDSMGSLTIVSGVLRQDGDWLKIDGKRVYNLKTDKFDKSVNSLKKFVASRLGYGFRF